MALISCPECKREISNSAAFCPRCGYPSPGGAPRFSNLSVGQVFSEGGIDWRVLHVDSHNNQALVIIKDIIAFMPHHQEFVVITWEDCTLRRWLNNEFFDSLSPAIKSRVQVVTNQNNAGSATQDKVFLLSVDEANTYFESNADRVARYNGSDFWWWLRSRGGCDHAAFVDDDVSTDGDDDYYGAFVDDDVSTDGDDDYYGAFVDDDYYGAFVDDDVSTDGDYDYYGAFVDCNGDVYTCGDIVVYCSLGVRPALWLNL